MSQNYTRAWKIDSGEMISMVRALQGTTTTDDALASAIPNSSYADTLDGVNQALRKKFNIRYNFNRRKQSEHSI